MLSHNFTRKIGQTGKTDRKIGSSQWRNKSYPYRKCFFFSTESYSYNKQRGERFPQRKHVCHSTSKRSPQHQAKLYGQWIQRIKHTFSSLLYQEAFYMRHYICTFFYVLSVVVVVVVVVVFVVFVVAWIILRLT
jgi:hypothetical protein